MINPLDYLKSAASWLGNWLPEAFRPNSAPQGISADQGSLESMMREEPPKPQGWFSWLKSFIWKTPQQKAPDTSGDEDLAKRLQQEEDMTEIYQRQQQVMVQAVLQHQLNQVEEKPSEQLELGGEEAVQLEVEELPEMKKEDFITQTSGEVSKFLQKMFPHSRRRVSDAHGKYNSYIRSLSEDVLIDPVTICDEEERKLTFKHQGGEGFTLSF